MFDLISLIKTVGYLGIFGIVFAESGLFIGFFLPGDSLLFTAGFLASQNFLNIFILCVLAFVGAVVGDNVGYAFGKKIGPAIFFKEDSLLFNKSHLEKSRIFYEKHGPKTLILARFMPIVRTFAPILAGVGLMRYDRFLLYNMIGGLLWGVGMPSLGYFLGNTVPNIDKYLLPIVIGIIVLSVLPTVMHILRNKDEQAQIKRFLSNLFKT